MDKPNDAGLKEEFDQYNTTNVEEYNKPDFNKDDGTVLKAKLDNFNRIGVPKKEKGE